MANHDFAYIVRHAENPTHYARLAFALLKAGKIYVRGNCNIERISDDRATKTRFSLNQRVPRKFWDPFILYSYPKSWQSYDIDAWLEGDHFGHFGFGYDWRAAEFERYEFGNWTTMVIRWSALTISTNNKHLIDIAMIGGVAKRSGRPRGMVKDNDQKIAVKARSLCMRDPDLPIYQAVMQSLPKKFQSKDDPRFERIYRYLRRDMADSQGG